MNTYLVKFVFIQSLICWDRTISTAYLNIFNTVVGSITDIKCNVHSFQSGKYGMRDMLYYVKYGMRDMLYYTIVVNVQKLSCSDIKTLVTMTTPV